MYYFQQFNQKSGIFIMLEYYNNKKFYLKLYIPDIFYSNIINNDELFRENKFVCLKIMPICFIEIKKDASFRRKLIQELKTIKHPNNILGKNKYWYFKPTFINIQNIYEKIKQFEQTNNININIIESDFSINERNDLIFKKCTTDVDNDSHSVA